MASSVDKNEYQVKTLYIVIFSTSLYNNTKLNKNCADGCLPEFLKCRCSNARKLHTEYILLFRPTAINFKRGLTRYDCK